jgi:hypothetical protein
MGFERRYTMFKNITLLTIVLGALALLTVPGAFADRAYSDQSGDAGTAPDVTAVRASHDAAGTIVFTVTTNQPVLAPDGTLYVYIDSDRNPATGLPVRGLGADHLFSHGGEYGTGFLWHVNGNFISFDFTSTLQTSYGGGTLTARVNRSDVGNPERFAFLVEAERDDENDATTNDADFAPDAAPFYEYSLVAVALAVGKPVAASKPVAGKAFTLSAAVTRSDGMPLALATMTCKAKAGAAWLRVSGRIANGSARCSMKIPKTAEGKMLRGTLTVSTDDTAAVSRPFAHRIG